MKRIFKSLTMTNPIVDKITRLYIFVQIYIFKESKKFLLFISFANQWNSLS